MKFLSKTLSIKRIQLLIEVNGDICYAAHSILQQINRFTEPVDNRYSGDWTNNLQIIKPLLSISDLGYCN